MAGREDDALQQTLEGVLARPPLQHVQHRKRLLRRSSADKPAEGGCSAQVQLPLNLLLLQILLQTACCTVHCPCVTGWMQLCSRTCSSCSTYFLPPGHTILVSAPRIAHRTGALRRAPHNRPVLVQEGGVAGHLPAPDLGAWPQGLGAVERAPGVPRPAHVKRGRLPIVCQEHRLALLVPPAKIGTSTVMH